MTRAVNTFTSALVALALSAPFVLTASARALDIYFIDVEGGQSTLIVTPEGESILVDAGFPGAGGVDGQSGDAHVARDANRIAAAAKDAGVNAIDYLIVTHFHADHDGGIPELAQLLPIRTFVDHDRPLPAVESVEGSLAAFDRYAAVRAKARHIVAKPGDRLKLKGAAGVVFVSSGGETITKALPGAGRPNPTCTAISGEAQEKNENPRSTGFLLQLGKFRFLDVGDLSGKPLFDLTCPKDLIGSVSVYLVAHHGGVDTADPASFAAFKPRAAVVNNGATKGGAPETFATLRRIPNVDVWQLHRSKNPGAENAPNERIANLDEAGAHWIKVRASDDGRFEVVNGRTGVAKKY